MEEQKKHRLYAPDWQLRAKMTWANELYVVAPRGTGKTEEILAQRAIECVQAMPKGKGAMIAVSYKKLKTQLLPPLISSWRKYGFHRGKQFWIGDDRRPKNWKIEEPYIAPVETTDFIQFSNGHGIHLISQDRAGMANGLSVEWIGADEARLMNKVRYDEDASAILRGHAALFDHLPQYNSVTMTTDMPLIDEGMWILDMEKEMDPELIEDIFEMSVILEELIQADEERSTKHSRAEIAKLTQMINEMRCNAVHYIEVSDGSNLIFLGEKFIKTQARVMERTRFNSSILGLRTSNLANKFYPLFSVEQHGYFKSNHSYLEIYGSNSVNDCRTDGDLSTSQPLLLAFDHNSSINWYGTGQWDGNDHQTLKSHFVLGREGKKLSNLLKDFIDYYFFHPNKNVIYIYDHTSIAGTASTDWSFKDEVIETLSRAGWKVEERYLGKAPFHDFKFKEIRDIHSGSNVKGIRSKINRDNNEQLIKLLGTTNGRVVSDKWEKDKTKEKQVKTFPQEDAPHGTDMYDLLLLGSIKVKFEDYSWMMT
jgi:hypothetical protein